MERRWIAAGYLAVIGAGIYCVWTTSSLFTLRGAATLVYLGVAGWFSSWRRERRLRLGAEQLAERAREQGNTPCSRCQHYACDGVECISCDGPCVPPKLTGPVDHASYWLN